MTSITLYDNEYITVEYLVEKKTIYHVVHKPVYGEQLHTALNIGTDALGEYKVCKWLSDDRKNGPLPPEDVQWGDEEWNPRTIKMGWKYWALIVPEEVVSASAMTPVIDHLYEFGLTMMVFTSVEAGMEWLDSQPNPAID